MSKLEELKKKLREIFQLDQTDLDFGIYKIMNEKSAEITDFLENKLLKQVKDSFKSLENEDKTSIQKELDEAIAQAKSLGANPDDLPKVKELKAQLTNSVDISVLENDVYSHLTNFFSRYYNGGDFMSLRRYKKDVYAIPYEGEEVKLHWANSDQYYIKTSENFKDYSFFIGEDENKKTVRFKLVEAEIEKDNNKSDKERRFMLVENEPVYIEDKELYIKFEYKVDENKKDQKFYNSLTLEKLLPELRKEEYSNFAGLFELAPTEKNKTRTILEKHLTDYTAKNSFDYFIHKDLGGFLNRELDFYIKNEVLNLDDLDEKNIQKNLGKAKAIKEIAKKLITFLAQLEEFQKKLWLKKKFVVETNYCITLDKVDEKFYPEIVNNKEQIEEWEKLFAISEIKTNLTKIGADVLNGNDDSKKIEFLKQNPYLQVDTKFFSTEFKYKLLSTIENLDEQTNGTLINSDNFHALNLLQEKYKEQVKCIYIDPPYNAQSSEILYKNTYKNSSWLSLIQDRVMESKNLLNTNGILVNAIDEVEQEFLGILLSIIFPLYNKTCVTIVHNPSGQQGENFSSTNEYAYFLYPKGARSIGLEVREDNVDIRNLRDVTGEDSLRTAAANCFYPIFIKEGKIVGFGDVCDNNYHPNVNEELPDGVIAVYPVDPQGIERKWRFARQTVETIKNELFAKFIKGRNVWDIQRTKNKFNYKTVWTDKKYFANNYGTQPLNQMFGKQVFSFPKSIYTVKDCISASLYNSYNPIILDYFAGSGTTGHATIELNRDDGGNRKYILVEMGKYFNTVTKPRIQKVAYSREWKDGKPVNRDGISQIFKYMSLESYEDACNNLQQKVSQIALSDKLEEQYKLNYMFDFEYSDSLLNIEMFENPFDYKMKITEGNETKERNIDLIETFNYLIGLNVSSIYQKDGFMLVEGTNREEENILVIWRNTKEKSNSDLDEFLKKRRISTQDFEFKKIYVNGDNNLQNQEAEENEFKVSLIEEEFKKRMFGVNI